MFDVVINQIVLPFIAYREIMETHFLKLIGSVYTAQLRLLCVHWENSNHNLSLTVVFQFHSFIGLTVLATNVFLKEYMTYKTLQTLFKGSAREK